MQVQNLQIFSSANIVAPASTGNGPWIEISNLVTLSVQINNFSSGSTDIEVSNDPNVIIDGSGIGAPGSAPTLKQFVSMPGFGSMVNANDASMLPAATYYVKTTYITKWGETSASSSASLSVPAGSYLLVAPAAPSTAQAPFVVGWNCYVSATGNAGTWVLQTSPPYSPQRLIDGIGTFGGTVSSLVGQSTHFAITGALPLAQNFSMVNGYQQTNWVPPASDQSGGTGSGVSVTSGAGFTSSSSDNTTVAVFVNGGNVMWTPSCMAWKYLRVTNGGSTTLAWICGQKG